MENSEQLIHTMLVRDTCKLDDVYSSQVCIQIVKWNRN